MAPTAPVFKKSIRQIVSVVCITNRPTGLITRWASCPKKGTEMLFASLEALHVVAQEVVPSWALFAVFLVMLFCILRNERQKIRLSIGGFVILAAMFMINGHTAADLFFHFWSWGTGVTLATLFVMFYIYEFMGHFYAQSNMSLRIGRRARTDDQKAWTIFVKSTFLDNICAALLGKKLYQGRYGTDLPLSKKVSSICAANGGGAGSPAGDTTTIMIVQQGACEWYVVAWAFLASIPAQFVMNYFTRSKDEGHIQAEEELPPIQIRKIYLLPLLAVVGLLSGLICQNLALNGIIDIPRHLQSSLIGVGLVLGFGVGMLLAMLCSAAGFGEFHVDTKHVLTRTLWNNTWFIIGLVMCADLLPVNDLKLLFDYLHLGPIEVAILLGLLSAVFDNIPLTQLAIRMGGLDYAFLAFTVGYGGNGLWSGSSAGVTVTKPDEGEDEDAPNPDREIGRWVGRNGWSWKVLAAYTVGVTSYLVIRKGISLGLTAFMEASKFEQILVCFGGWHLCWAIAGIFCWSYPGKVSATRQVGMVAFALAGAALLLCGFGVMRN